MSRCFSEFNCLDVYYCRNHSGRNIPAAGDADLDEELGSVGLDRFELELMDEDERREALEDAGLDPDDYDDF